MSRLKTHGPDADGTIAGKYRLVEKIGEGAMGSVWSAINVATGREVALKRMIRSEPELRRRLEREARSCGALRHRNVVDVYDMVETADGEPFLVMQLLSGETLAELLARRRRVEPELGAAIGRDVARGLAAAHALHIVHRDLKPSNIFLHREPGASGWIVKVLDFGVAKNLSINDGFHTMPGGAVGSPLYMSPEQVRADSDIDHRTDIWTLGVVLFEMLTGERPFRGNPTEVFAAILTGEIPTLARTLWRVDGRLVDIVARCMRREREERFRTAAEVAELLDEIATARRPLPRTPGEARETTEAVPPQAIAQTPHSPQTSAAGSATDTAATGQAAPGHRRDPGSSTTPVVTSSSRMNLASRGAAPGTPEAARRSERRRQNTRVAAAAPALALWTLVAMGLALSKQCAPRAATPAHESSGSPSPAWQRTPESGGTAASPARPAPADPARADGVPGATTVDGARLAPEPPAPAPTSNQRAPAPSSGTSAQAQRSPRRPSTRQPKDDPCAGETGLLRTLCLDNEARTRSPREPRR
ncbi:serine/threonine-protein kinase [Sorangium sp. So ce426]|uniref:serine/threonine-protein kinase n=1 Tax=Sorangium sp. So ce426 TaxID=3133312 RepID=UPI003F5C85BE